MRFSEPIVIEFPEYGVVFAESVHASDFQMAERADPYHKLVYVLSGSVEFRNPDGSAVITIPTGDVIVVAERTRHTIRDIEPSALLILCLDRRFMESDPDLGRTWSEMARLSTRRLQPSRPTRLRLESMWRRAMMESKVRRSGGGLAVRALATQILVLLSRIPAPQSSDTASTRVSAVIREIDETFYEEWSLDRAAIRAGMSRRHFSALFRTIAGMAFQAYLSDKRLTHAARMLKAGEHSVLGVMFSCGYNDVSTFYRQFRARFQQPPKAWMSKAGRGRNDAAASRTP